MLDYALTYEDTLRYGHDIRFSKRKQSDRSERSSAFRSHNLEIEQNLIDRSLDVCRGYRSISATGKL